MAKNQLAYAINETLKRANRNAARCVMVWAALALREEGYGKKRIKRVLEKIHKYAETTNGRNSIEEQLKHIERTVGLRIVWTEENEITIDEIDEQIKEMEEEEHGSEASG